MKFLLLKRNWETGFEEAFNLEEFNTSMLDMTLEDESDILNVLDDVIIAADDLDLAGLLNAAIVPSTLSRKSTPGDPSTLPPSARRSYLFGGMPSSTPRKCARRLA